MPRYDEDFDDYDDIRIGRFRHREPRELPHSGLGIVSFFISIVAGLGMFVLFVAIVLIDMQQNGPINNNDPLMTVLGLAFVGGSAVALVGLVLGITGAMQPDRKGLYGVLGSIFNALILIGACFLICLGIIAG